MSRIRRVLAPMVVAIGVLLPTPGSAQEPVTTPEGPDNTAIAINTKDGADLFRLAFSIDRLVTGEKDDPDNAAVAYSSCNACETTAIAIQFVIMTTPPEGEFSPTNLAIAINDQCQSCETVALAYQTIIFTDGPVKLSKEGKEQVKDIVDQLRALEDQDLPPAELDARTDTLVDQLGQVLNEELEPKHTSGDAQTESETGDQQPTDTLPDPNMTSSPDDNVNVDGGDGSPPPASPTADGEGGTPPAVSPEGSPSAEAEPTP